MPYEPITIGCSLPSLSRYVAPSGSEYLVPSLKMLPTSMTGSSSRGAPDTGHPSPAMTSRMSAISAWKSRPSTTPRRWTPARLAPVT